MTIPLTIALPIARDYRAQAERVEEAAKKARTKLSHAVKGFGALEADTEDMGNALDEAATALKAAKQALNKQKAHAGNAKSLVQDARDTLEAGMA